MDGGQEFFIKEKVLLAELVSHIDLDLGHGRNTDSWSRSRAVTKQTTVQQADETEDTGGNENEGGEVQKGNRGLGLSASSCGVLDDAVTQDVAFVST